MRRRSLGAGRRAYRRGQSAVLFALALLVVLVAATGLLYERAVEQATVRSTLTGADRVSRSLSIGVGLGTGTDAVAPRGRAARLFGAPITGTDLPAALNAKGYGTLATSISYRVRECAHLRLTTGHCPRLDGEVVASTSLAGKLHLAVGSTLKVLAPSAQDPDAFPVTIRIVGLYRPFPTDNDYWFGTHYSSPSGIVVSSDAVQADAFFAGESFVDGTAAKVSDGDERQPQAYVDVPLEPDRVGVDDLPALRASLTGLVAGQGPVTDVETGLPDYLDEIDAGRRDARRVVLAISVQLALLTVLAFGVVVAAAADQRRPELALARLRGRSPVRSAAVFLREIGGLALLAVVPGTLGAFGLVTVACHVWLVPGVRPAWRWPVPAAVLGSAIVMLLVIAAIGLRTGRQPITDLLRQVAKRVSRAGPGTTEVAVGVAAVAGLLASLGQKDNALATLTPTFLAVIVGLTLSRLLAVGARAAGRRALWRGDLTYSLAALGIGRRTTARFTVPVLCVATAVVVFAGQQWSVASTNRAQRAAAVTGAAVVLDVSAPSGAALVAAVHDADPSGGYATPVVVAQPPGIEAAPTVAVDPASFGRVASWGRAGLRPSPAVLRRVEPTHEAPAISFHGSELTLGLASAYHSTIYRTPHSKEPRVGVSLDYTHADGSTAAVDLGPLPAVSPQPLTLRGAVGCTAGCRLTGVQITRPALDSDPVDVTFTVATLTVATLTVAGPTAGTGLRIGRAAQWATTTEPDSLPAGSGTTHMAARDTPTGLEFQATDDGGNSAMQYLDVPIASPALLAGPAPTAKDPLGYLDAQSLDGSPRRIVAVGRLPFVPNVGGAATVVDLDLAIRTSTVLDPTSHPSVWLGRDDATREKLVVAALRRHGVTVVQRTSESTLRSQLARSAPGWSAQLTLAAAVISELLAIALLVLVVLTSRRARQQDLAALRLVGLSGRRLRRASALELLVLVAVGVAGGVGAGLVAVRLSLSSIPVFLAAPSVPLAVVFPLEWPWLVGAVVLCVVPLVVAALTLARGLVRRATPRSLGGGEA